MQFITGKPNTSESSNICNSAKGEDHYDFEQGPSSSKFQRSGLLRRQHLLNHSGIKDDNLGSDDCSQEQGGFGNELRPTEPVS